MATITERITKTGQKRYMVQIRLKGARPITETFPTKTAAKEFAASQESDIRRGAHLPAQESKRRTFKDLADRYAAAILPKKGESTAKVQALQLEYFKGRMGHLLLSTITPSLIADERDHLAQGTTRSGKPRKGATVVRYLALLRHVFAHAEKELEWVTLNPARNVAKPKESKARCRTLEKDEREALLAACKASSNVHLYTITVIALSTGARRGEIRNLKWDDIDFERRVITLKDTKNGDTRALSIRSEAERLLKKASNHRRANNPYVFPAPRRPGKEARPIDFQSAWDAAVIRAGIKDFRFHDTRHCAASDFAKTGATLVELANLLGHKSLSMVARYSHLNEDHTGDLVERMNENLFGTK